MDYPCLPPCIAFSVPASTCHITRLRPGSRVLHYPSSRFTTALGSSILHTSPVHSVVALLVFLSVAFSFPAACPSGFLSPPLPTTTLPLLLLLLHNYCLTFIGSTRHTSPCTPHTHTLSPPHPFQFFPHIHTPLHIHCHTHTPYMGYILCLWAPCHTLLDRICFCGPCGPPLPQILVVWDAPPPCPLPFFPTYQFLFTLPTTLSLPPWFPPLCTFLFLYSSPTSHTTPHYTHIAFGTFAYTHLSHCTRTHHCAHTPHSAPAHCWLHAAVARALPYTYHGVTRTPPRFMPHCGLPHTLRTHIYYYLRFAHARTPRTAALYLALPQFDTTFHGCCAAAAPHSCDKPCWFLFPIRIHPHATLLPCCG